MAKIIRVLIVDDSSTFRSLIRSALKNQKDIEVVGEAANGLEAVKMAKELRPDLVSLDVEMPRMDGLTALQRINTFNSQLGDKEKIGVIMLSAYTQKGADTTIKALEKGAFDFIAKPQGNFKGSMDNLRRQLLIKARSYVSQRIARAKYSQGAGKSYSRPIKPRPMAETAPLPSKYRAIVIGVSTGGPRALAEMLPGLCGLVDIPIFIVQHMPENFTESLAHNLDERCPHKVVEARDNMDVETKTTYLAPGGRHMVLDSGGNHAVKVHTNTNPPENGCRPAADVLFRSAAKAYPGKVLAIVMTGMGNDGAKALTELKQAGAYVIAQDEKSSVVWGMPGSAVQTGLVDAVLPLNEIPLEAARLVNKR